MTAEEVTSAWELPVHLAEAVAHIRNHDARAALVDLNAHLLSVAWSSE